MRVQIRRDTHTRTRRTPPARCVLYSGGYQNRATLETVGVPVADTLVDALDRVREMT